MFKVKRSPGYDSRNSIFDKCKLCGWLFTYFISITLLCLPPISSPHQQGTEQLCAKWQACLSEEDLSPFPIKWELGHRETPTMIYIYSSSKMSKLSNNITPIFIIFSPSNVWLYKLHFIQVIKCGCQQRIYPKFIILLQCTIFFSFQDN